MNKELLETDILDRKESYRQFNSKLNNICKFTEQEYKKYTNSTSVLCQYNSLPMKNERSESKLDSSVYKNICS